MIVRDDVSVPSSCISCQHDGKTFLYLGCKDGHIRVYDTEKQEFIGSVSGCSKSYLAAMVLSADMVLADDDENDASYVSN